MELFRLILASLCATSVMTLFSYYVSEKFNEIFKEPVLLNYTLSAVGVDMIPKYKNICGWVIHYMIGFVFSISYELVWVYTDFDPTWFCGLIFGIISGAIGIFSWMLLFQLPRNPPKIHFKEYYLQLFFAHIIFALVVVGVYKIFIAFE